MANLFFGADFIDKDSGREFMVLAMTDGWVIVEDENGDLSSYHVPQFCVGFKRAIYKDKTFPVKQLLRRKK